MRMTAPASRSTAETGAFACKLCGASSAGRRYRLRQHATGSPDFTAVECRGCGLFQDFYDWQGAESAQQREVEEFVETAPGELWESERELAAHQAKAEVFAAELDRRGEVRGRRILEIGCRRGFFLKACLDRGAAHVTGQEFFRAAPIEYARTELGLTDLRTAPFTDLASWPDREFDVVCSFDVLVHVHDLRSLLAECVRLTRPGGLLFHATPGSDSVTARAGRLLARAGLDTFRPLATSLCNVQAPVSWRGGPHVAILSSAALGHVAGDLGFTVEDARYVSSYTYSNRHYAALVPLLNRLPPKVGEVAFEGVRRTIRNKLVFAARVK